MKDFFARDHRDFNEGGVGSLKRVVVHFATIQLLEQVGQVQGLNVVWSPADKSATLSWTTLAGASGYSVYRKFGVSRIMLREMALKGELPGVRKASW